jgi:hypothetical protein
MVIFADGEQASSKINFRIPIRILERFFYGEVRAVPVFDERRAQP